VGNIRNVYCCASENIFVTRTVTATDSKLSKILLHHVRGVVTNCSQTHYALRVLRTHGMSDSSPQIIFRSVVVAKLLYACSAWWVGLHQCDRPAASQRLLSAQYSLRLLSAWFASVRWAVPGCRPTALLQHHNSGHLFHIDFFLRLLQRRRTISFASANTIGNNLRILDIWRRSNNADARWLDFKRPRWCVSIYQHYTNYNLTWDLLDGWIIGNCG